VKKTVITLAAVCAIFLALQAVLLYGKRPPGLFGEAQPAAAVFYSEAGRIYRSGDAEPIQIRGVLVDSCLPGYYSYDDGYRSSGQSNVYTTCTPSEDFDEIVHNIQLVEWLEDSISKECGLLNDDERRVLILHYGLFGTQPQPYKEIAKLRRAEGRGFACSRLSQISTQAKKKLSAYFAEIGLEEY